MPRGRRLERLTSRLKQDLGEIIAHQLKDPRIGITTVTRVKLAPDLATAIVSVTVLGNDVAERAALGALRRARGHIQSEIARILDVRRHPELQFEIDKGIKHSREVSRILADLKKESHREAGEDAETQQKEEET